MKKETDSSQMKVNAEEKKQVEEKPKEAGCIQKRFDWLAKKAIGNEDREAVIETIIDGIDAMMRSPELLKTFEEVSDEIIEMSITKALDKVSEQDTHDRIVKIATEIAEDTITPLIEREKRKIAGTAVAVAGVGVAATLAFKSGKVGNGVAALKKLL